MKTKAMILAALLCCSCADIFNLQEQGALEIYFPDYLTSDASASSPTKASSLPDTNSFILSVKDSKGKSLYYGSFGAAPSRIMVDEGTYTVSAVSQEFTTPAFDAAQYGDNQVVKVKSGSTTTVILNCSQLNCGVRLVTSPDFLDEYPGGSLWLKSTDGKLMYSYTEKRIAYFRPGTVSLILNNDGKDKNLMSRSLLAQQILTLNISTSGGAAGTATGGISISVDTSRNWLNDNVLIGGGTGSGTGSATGSALSVPQAQKSAGSTDVWVYGYIVGGDLSSTRCSFTMPFNSRTNLVIAAKSSCTEKASCLSVQLAKGDVRDALNLVDHPDLVGRQVFLKGDLVESYYGIPGIQNISEYELKP